MADSAYGEQSYPTGHGRGPKEMLDIHVPFHSYIQGSAVNLESKAHRNALDANDSCIREKADIIVAAVLHQRDEIEPTCRRIRAS
jgi:hypothetical protein